MATFFPRELPHGLNECERKVFSLLNRLGEDCFIYYEPHVRNRRPDFVVVIPDVGVLVVEAKGCPINQIVRATPERITCDTPEGRKTVKHPQEQARDYAFGFINALRDHPAAKHILRTSGPYLGNFAFPVSWIAAYCNITRDALEERDLSPCFPENRNVTCDELSKWSRLDDQALRAALKSYFDPWWPHSMSWFETTLIRNKFYPIVIPKQSGEYTSTDIKVLDADQEQIAFRIGPGHRVVYGVAGSGKTVILIARAKFIGGDPKRRVLILCYNKYLAEHISLQTSDYNNIKTYTFHSWGNDNGATFIANENDESHAERLLNVMESGTARDAGQFDAVLIDEAQLLQANWLKAAKLALKEPSSEHSHLFVAGDGTQSVFRKRPFTWADVGINARGRTTILKRNYRNTEEIIAAALIFAAPSELPDTPGPGGQTPVPECLRHGPKPELVTRGSRQQEENFVTDLIRSWLSIGIVIRDRREVLRPSDIAVLYPFIPQRDRSFVEDLQDRLNTFTKAVVLEGTSGKLSDEGVRIISIQRATGLQFRAVIMLWTDLLPANFTDRDDRTLLYLGMTRAEDVLVILHSGRSELVDEIQRALSGQNAT